jgi:hypothetical protein
MAANGRRDRDWEFIWIWIIVSVVAVAGIVCIIFRFSPLQDVVTRNGWTMTGTDPCGDGTTRLGPGQTLDFAVSDDIHIALVNQAGSDGRSLDVRRVRGGKAAPSGSLATGQQGRYDGGMGGEHYRRSQYGEPPPLEGLVERNLTVQHQGVEDSRVAVVGWAYSCDYYPITGPDVNTLTGGAIRRFGAAGSVSHRLPGPTAGGQPKIGKAEGRPGILIRMRHR